MSASLVLVTALTLCASNGAQVAALERAPEGAIATPRSFEKELTKFRRLTSARQVQILRSVRLAVSSIEDDYLRSVRSLAQDAHRNTSRAKRKIRAAKKKTTEKKKTTATRRGTDPDRSFWIERDYAFGFATIYNRPSTGARQRNASRARELESMLLGFTPEFGDALAGALRQLDSDRGADPFARLLEEWHDGPDSFYRALDRTAGTDDSVFFYDAMLGDFIKRCVPRNDPDYRAIRKSLDKAHDSLHRSFLAYRQYRAFREAIAWSLLLPPGLPLPAALRRYEQVPNGGLSVRQQVALLLLDGDQDISSVIQAVVRGATPMPSGLWRKKYDPFPAFLATVMGERDGSTRAAPPPDQVIERQMNIRSMLQQRIAKTALASLRAALYPAG